MTRTVLLALLVVGSGCSDRPLVAGLSDGSVVAGRPAACTGSTYVRFPSFLQFEPNRYSAWQTPDGRITVRASRHEASPDGSSWAGVDVSLSCSRSSQPVPPLMLDLSELPPGWDLRVSRFGGSSSVGSASSVLPSQGDAARGWLRLTAGPEPTASLCLSILVARWTDELPQAETLELWVDRVSLEIH